MTRPRKALQNRDRKGAGVSGGTACDVSQREVARRDSLNNRIKPEVRGLVGRAAALAGKNRTDFVLDAARHAAEEALLDRTVFALNPKACAAFLARLDAPLRPNQRLRKSLQTAAPWE